MQRLALFDALDERIIGAVRPRIPLKRLRVDRHPADLALFPYNKDRVAYTLAWYAEMTVENTADARQAARISVSQALGREVYGEVARELFTLLEWVQEEGIGSDLEKRIYRVIELCQGGGRPHGGT